MTHPHLRVLLRVAALGLALAWVESAPAAPVVSSRVVEAYPHDRGAFTQGLVLRRGELFESTGLFGESTVRRVDPTTGDVLQMRALAADEFGEGLALVDDRLIQLTWQNGFAHVYDVETFETIGRFEYAGEGWGLCYDGRRLIMSDGSDQLFFRDLGTFEILGSILVQDQGRPYPRLNELECVSGEVFANVWLTDDILRINAETGDVLEKIDASGLLSAGEAGGVDVLNGIAFDPASGHFLLTGKLWPRLFEVEFPGVGAAPEESGALCSVASTCSSSKRWGRRPRRENWGGTLCLLFGLAAVIRRKRRSRPARATLRSTR